MPSTTAPKCKLFFLCLELTDRLKSANEEKQRETRRLRAEGKLPPHEPRWFTAVTEPDTSERLWEPKRADDGEVKFWAEREVQGQKPPEARWADVDHIFADD